MSLMNMEKEELRQKLLERRNAIAGPVYKKASATIVKKLQSLEEFRQSKTIHCYVSMNDRREVNTHRLIQRMLQGNKTVVVPVTQFADKSLKHVALTSFGHLKPNKWGVLEPEIGAQVSHEQVDLVVVPMVGADEQCNRIGYGAGFYDRFLSSIEVIKIGLIFENNVEEYIPTEPFDVRMDKIITDERIIECGKKRS